MKRIVIVALIMALKSASVFAQSDTLLIGENQKFIYYQVVSQPDLPADTLYNRGLLFLQKAYGKDRLKFLRQIKQS
ncbi:hypothetical protein [Mucilaginibacter antarcticus]|uniref:hypothetical protein n=1 Tax=Mucilaginibacter antarcticus TaxID=1855725 RepID=UPI00363B4946